MKFFQKRSVAWVIAICMIVAAIFIGQYKQQQNAYRPSCETEAEKWAWENNAAYDRYIADDADLLSKDVRTQISVYNAESDYVYDVVCGVCVLDQTTNTTPEAAAEQAFAALQLSSRDMVLVLDSVHETWYVNFGSAVSENDQHDLKLLTNETGDTLLQANGTGVLKLFSNLKQWYGEHLKPFHSVNHWFQLAKFVGKTAWNLILASLLICAIVIGGIVYAIIRVCKNKAPDPTDGSVRRASERHTADQTPQYTSQRRQNTDKTQS